jgi:hypothetical protein
MRLFAFPAPSGAAVRLVFGLPKGQAPHVRATLGPDPLDPAGRDVVLPETRTLPAEPPFVALEATTLEYRQVIDMDLSLQVGPVYYHLRAHGGNEWVRVQVDASRPRRQALVSVARDLLRPRLEWHLARAVQEGRIRPALGYVPILEQHALAKDDPLPAILLKEAITPIGIPIGMARGEWRPAAPGQAYRENSYHYRAKVDLLILSETPSERTDLANLVHGAILIDQPLLEDRGWRGLEVARFTDMAFDPAGFPRFAEEVSVDGEVTFVVREEMSYSVSEPETFFAPL